MAEENVYLRLKIFGLVQGIGFRPFVLRLCSRLGIKGVVKNTGASAYILANTDEKNAGALIRRLSCIKGNDPEIPGARVDDIIRENISGEAFERECPKALDFRIEKSNTGSERIRFIPPDIGICSDCKRELLDPKNRRYRHPFISCSACGPRYSIMYDIPYDRENTSMQGFALCEECKREYTTEGKRRHAQTIACNDCGPKLQAFIRGSDGKIVCAAQGDDALKMTMDLIREGKTAAVKNTGGYHFVFDAARDGVAGKLREYKNRETKPFAVMFSDVSDIEEYCEVSGKERELLESAERPIVLLKKRKGKDLAKGVCEDSPSIGAMLPCDGIQVLLLEDKRPLVMTSANRGGQPVEGDDEKARLFLSDNACDIVLSNDRQIINPLDDSIYRVIDTGEEKIIQTLRRARGIVPLPVTMPASSGDDVFAAGGDLKSVFAFARDDRAFLSGHFGDLSDETAVKRRRDSKKNFEKIFGMQVRRYAADAHPLYHSLQEIIKEDPVKVQHHYAHLLSVAAEHGLSGKIMGAVFDGTGYGDDGTVRGGEFLVADTAETGSFERAGHLMNVRLAGGDSAAIDAEKTAMCFVHEAISQGLLDPEENPFRGEKYETISKALENNINVHFSSSAGRFFDACAALLGICTSNSYEGECPQKLEAEAWKAYDKGRRGEVHIAVPEAFCTDEGFTFDTEKITAQLVRLKASGKDVSVLALAIHEAVSGIITDGFEKMREKTGINRALLSGGTFANALLITMLFPELKKSGFEVYTNEKVPPGDGGLALGQVFAMTEEG